MKKIMKHLLLHFHPSKDYQLSSPCGLYYFGASISFPWKHLLQLWARIEVKKHLFSYAESHTCFHQSKILKSNRLMLAAIELNGNPIWYYRNTHIYYAKILLKGLYITSNYAEIWRFSACPYELNNILVPDFSAHIRSTKKEGLNALKQAALAPLLYVIKDVNVN